MPICVALYIIIFVFLCSWYRVILISLVTKTIWDSPSSQHLSIVDALPKYEATSYSVDYVPLWGADTIGLVNIEYLPFFHHKNIISYII